MKSFSYFFEDIKNIFKNPASIGTLIALMLIPGFYAWFNIVASWDPYANTKNIKIAVANEDLGTEILGKNLNIGAEVVENLQENHNMGWNFVSADEARKGVYEGDFYASIIIGENFSEDLSSFLTENPKKPKLEYIVNEKINAISPKITGKWVEALSETIEANFISSIYENFFKQSNLAAEKIKSYEQNAKKAKKLVDEVAVKLPAIRATLEKWKSATEQGQAALIRVENELPHLSETLQHIADLTANSPDTSKYAEKISHTAIASFHILELLVHDGIFYTDFAHQKTENLQTTLSPALQNSQHKMLLAERFLGNFEKFFTRLNNLTSLKIFDGVITKIKDLREKIQKYVAINRKIFLALERGEQITHTLLGEMMEKANAVNASLGKLREYFTGDFLMQMQKLNDALGKIFSGIHTGANELNAKIPELQAKIDTLQNALDKGSEKIDAILEHWTQIETAILTTQKILAKMDDERIASLLEIMLLNPDDEKNFFRHPVEIETVRLFSAPNYGSAIAPFFTVLALWTGALLASSILSVRSRKAHQEKNIRHGYFGRFLFFASIGMFQATIITLGNIFALGVYVVHPWLFFLATLLIITLFHALIFLVVFLFGKIGNVIAILLLLLQLSAGSGTFPVELTNDIFMKIHPFIPFTYAIDLLREVSLGLVASAFWKNIFVLIIMLILSLVIGLLLAPKLSPFALKFNKRTEGIDIFN